MRRENGTNLPHAPPASTSHIASTSHSLARALSHAKTSEREIACLAVIRAFETGTAVAAVERLRQYQTENVLLTLLERLGDEQAAIRNLAAGALRNITSFDDPRIVQVLMQSKVLDVLNGLITRLPHLLPGMMQQSCARAGGATGPGVAPADNDAFKFHEELLAVVLNMCEVSQAATDYVGVSTNIPVVLFQLLVMPVYYDEGNDLKCLDQVPLVYPHADLGVCAQAAELLHALTEDNERLNKDMRRAKGGAHVKALVRAIDHVSSHRLAGCGGRMHVIHWHMLGVLSNLCQTFDDYVGVIDRGAKLLRGNLAELEGEGGGLGARIQSLLEQWGKTQGAGTDQVGQQAEQPLSPLLDALAAIKLGMEVLGNILEFDESRQAREHVLSNCWDLALGMARLASANLLLPWRARMGAGTEALKETLTLQCVDVNVHAANFVESFLHHFDPTSHVITRNNTVHKFETLWFDLSTAAYRNVTLTEKLSKENPPLSLVASGGMAELATQLMRASEQACLCFLEANASAKLDTPKRLEVVVRVALHDRGGAVLDEARSSALRVLGHHAVMAPGTLATHFGGVCVQLLKPGVDAAVASILVLVDLLDVMFDVFGNDATDPVFRSLGTFFFSLSFLRNING